MIKKINVKVDTMNRKINTICFIFLLFFMICAVSAADNENETLQSIEQPDPNQDLSKLSVENVDENIIISSTSDEKLSVVNENNTILKATSTVKKEKVTLKAPDVKMHYKDGTKFKVTIKDKNKKAINKAKIKITINGKSYSKTTDSKGTASIDLNLNSGSYTAVTSFAATNKYEAQSIKSKITIKSTIKCSDFTKYYTNKAAYYSTFYDKKGKLLKDTAVKFKLNSKTYSVKTSAKGVGKLNVDLKPGKYSVSVINSKTSETIKKTITIKTIMETKDLTMNECDKKKFTVKILNSNGKLSPNKKVSIKVNGKTHTKTTNKTGIASLDINLKAGNYSITTEYLGIKHTNKIVVKSVIKEILKPSNYTHTTLIPNYVNITNTFNVGINSSVNGVIKLPKNEIFTIQIGKNSYSFTTGTSYENVITLGYKSYLIPFDGSGLKSDINKNNLKGNGILISKVKDYTQIEFRSQTTNNTELLGVYADKGLQNSETINYLKNDEIVAKVNFRTESFNELALKYSLSRLYGKYVSDFNSETYDKITNHNTELIKYSNTGKPVTLSYFGNFITGPCPKEDILTKFSINGSEELEKSETISYGLADNYRKTYGFEVLQAFSIINEKITKEKLEKWVSLNNLYLDRFGVMNVYGMHLASLETAWLADELANNYSKEFNVKWERSNTLSILGGINLDDTYLHILNADMGMNVNGSNPDNVKLFRMMNSIYLPYLEDYSLNQISERFMKNTTNSLDCIYKSVISNNFSLVQLGDYIYLFSEDGSNSAIVLNNTSGVANVILSNGNNTYKGSVIGTAKDCCSVCIIAKSIISGIRELFKFVSPTTYLLSDHFKKIHPFTTIAYPVITAVLKKTLTGASSMSLGLFTTMALVQTAGSKYRDEIVDDKDLYEVTDKYTFTRPGYLQGKKIYNIPNKKGGTDYIEVKIKSDLTLDRDNAIYISEGNTKKLTKKETYNYFSEDNWTPINMPIKYWDKSWRCE